MIDRSARRLIARWLIGAVLGTALIGLSSPLFVRSYLPQSIDPIRGVRTLPEGAVYRWRSEGYADSLLGPLGMLGKTAIDQPDSGTMRIALWGDSQAEGVCVDDERKLFAQIQRRSGGKLTVFPLARSGDDLADWIRQIPAVESELAIDMHLILIADLPDLLWVDRPPSESRDLGRWAQLPAFLLQTVRNLITQSDGTSRRRLRFSVGPAGESQPAAADALWQASVAAETVARTADSVESIRRLRASTDQPILILYAPPSPQIYDGETYFTDRAADRLAIVQRIAMRSGIDVINVHPWLCEAAQAGRWPHGFQNGQIGRGHLNAQGYAVIARVLVDSLVGANESQDQPMLFTQLEFPIFFTVVFLATWICRTASARNSLLLAASYYFYAYWDYRFCGLLILSTGVDFVVALSIASCRQRSAKRWWLLVSLVVNLAVLGFFKYCNFFIETAAPLLQGIGLSGSTLSIILPVGISFYTFQTLSYTIDVYRGVIKPTDRLLDFALYVAFFPQLVAGPIVRARELLPQLAAVPRWSKRRLYGGAQLMLRGAVKKVLLADRLGEMVDVVFAGPDLYSGATVWIAVLAYSGQIYLDFSGYTDIAIGAAKMLGYRFPVNFRHPYLATSIADFWHRWHMTLSRWLRDYVYISIGGNRQGAWNTYRNLMITMVLGGLWHGAAWTFVLWGLWHGLALVVERFSGESLGMHRSKLVGWLMTFLVVVAGWVLFRSESLSVATVVFEKLLTFSGGIGWYPPLAVGALACLVIEQLAWRTRLRRAMRLPITAWYSPIATTVMIWALVLYPPQGFRPFVYFQF